MTIQFVKEVLFKNWTTKDFTHMFAGEKYDFEAGGTYRMPSDIAVHFAYHLAVRELLSSGDTRDESLPDGKMTEYQTKCFPEGVKNIGVANTFERVDAPTKDVSATEKKAPQENKTAKEEQKETSDNDDADASDDKNNAGSPLIKGLKKSKDAQYVKVK